MFLAMIAAITIQTAPIGESTGGRPLRPKSSPQTWVRDLDFPEYAQRMGAFGTIGFKLQVDATGRPTECAILNTSGFWLLDNRACELLIERGRFDPALDTKGVAISSSFHSRFNFNLEDAGRSARLALIKEVTEPKLLEVTVQKLPASYKEPALVRVRFAGDDRPSECRLELTSGSTAIDKAACTQAMAGAERTRLTNAGAAQPDTRMILVAFAKKAE